MELDFWSIASASDSHAGKEKEAEEDGREEEEDGFEYDLHLQPNKRPRLVDEDGDDEWTSSTTTTGVSDIPSSILTYIISIIRDTRSRNSVSLVCREWFHMERSTRTSISLRGNVNDLHNLPSTFTTVRSLDLSHVSPWGGTLFHSPHSAVCSQLVSQWLHRAFPSVLDLTVYVRDAFDLHMVASSWPGIHSLHLIRWHQRPIQPEEAAEPGTELRVLLGSCPKLVHLDLSGFYCWTEDVAPALEQSSCGSNLRSLNLLKQSPEGFKLAELTAITSVCRSLEELYSVCEFDPRFPDCVSDECLALCSVNCPGLRVLHLVDSSQFGGLRSQELPDGEELEASVTARGLESVFQSLPNLQELVLLLGQSVRDSAPGFDSLAKHCRGIRSLRLSHFQGVVSSANNGSGILRCSSLQELSLKSSSDLTDQGLSLIAAGCPRLWKLSLRSCHMITESGLLEFTAILRRGLIHIEIESCHLLATTAQILRALAPVRTTLRHLHLDCLWSDDLEQIPWMSAWKSLENLSLWIAAAQILTPVMSSGFNSCPVLRTLSIRVEGDCRLFGKPQAREFGLRSFSRFESLHKLRLDLSEAIGYALSAPGGNRDLSIWERFYLQGIQTLPGLRELDYYPPSDKDVNYRGMTLPGVGLISQCLGLRKLFVHGTAYEHLFMMLLNIPSLRDCQLRTDYFPTPEMETGTEMRPESCRRFEKLLEQRGYPD